MGIGGSRRRLGPLQVRVRDRVSVRVVRREPERLVDPLFQLLRDHVLETLRLAVDLVDVDAERLREIQLEQAVVADDLERHSLACIRQRDASIGLVDGEVASAVTETRLPSAPSL